MDECEDREEGVPPSKSSLCGEQENQSKAQRNPPGHEPGPASSCVSFKSDWSKRRLIDFKDHQAPFAKKIHQRPESSGSGSGPASSCVSFKSDWSLVHLFEFTGEQCRAAEGTTCCSVGRVLQLCGSRVDLSLTAEKMSVRRTSLLFTNPTQLHSLRLSNAMVLVLFQWVRRSKLMCPLTVEDLCLVAQKDQASERKLLKVVSSLSSLLRSCSVRQLVLTESCIPVQCLIPLLLHHGPPTIKLSEDHVQQLLVLVHEVQDQDLTLSLLSVVSGDLTSCCLNWELLHYLLQQSPAQTITVNLRKNLFFQESAARLLPFLGRIVIKRWWLWISDLLPGSQLVSLMISLSTDVTHLSSALCELFKQSVLVNALDAFRPSPSLVMTSIRELYRAHASHMVPSLLRSLDHVIKLSCRELDSVDSAALLFTLRHSDGVKVDLRWTSIPEEGTRSILSTLDRVSQLRTNEARTRCQVQWTDFRRLCMSGPVSGCLVTEAAAPAPLKMSTPETPPRLKKQKRLEMYRLEWEEWNPWQWIQGKLCFLLLMDWLK